MTTPPNIVRRKLSDLIGLGRLGLEAIRFRDPDVVHLVKIMTQSVRAYLDERFESEEIKATLATDGVIGTKTRAAVRAWQKASGLTADGHLTLDLARRLQQQAGQATAPVGQ